MLYGADDDEQALTITRGSKKGNLFGMEKAGSQRRSASFTHSTTKQSRQKDSSKDIDANTTATVASVVDAYKYIDNRYESQGKFGATLLANQRTKIYNIVLYANSEQQALSVRITSTFAFNVQQNNYASFYDDSRQLWSIMFDDSEEAESFARQVAVAKANISAVTKLIQQDLSLGDGGAIESGDSVEVKYTGWLFTNGTFGKVFEQSGEDNYVRFKVGRGKVIKGWDQSMVGMRKGGKRLLIIPHSLAYGSHGVPERIPPNSTVIIEVQVVRVRLQKEESHQESSTPAPPPVQIPAFVPFPDLDEIDEAGIRGYTRTITEHLSHVPDGNKAKLISRMARMGQPMLPLHGTVSAHSEDSDDEVNPRTPPVSAKPPLATKPRSATVIGTTGHARQVFISHPPAEVLSYDVTVTGSQPLHVASPSDVHQPQPRFLQNLQSGQQLALYQNPNTFIQQQQLLQQQQQQQAALFQQQLLQQQTQLLGQELTTNVGAAPALTPAFGAVTGTHPPPPPPIPQIQPPSSTAEPLAPVLLTESRQQNTEIRLDLSKISEKVDKILQKVEDLGTTGFGTNTLRTVASFSGITSIPSIEANVLMKNVNRIVEENDRLKKEVQEQNTKVQEQNERIAVMLERNQKYVEQSHSLLEQRNEGFKATASQSQTRVLALEQEKVQLSTELSSASAQISTLQLELGLFRKREGELMQQLKTATTLNTSTSEELDKLQLQKNEDKQKIELLTAVVRDEKQIRKTLETKVASLREELTEIKGAKETLEKNFNEKKRRSAEERRKFEEEMEDAKHTYEETIEHLRESLRKLKSSVETETHSRVSKAEEDVSHEWQRKCDRMIAAVTDKHTRELNDMKDDKNDLMRKISDMEKKLEASRLSASSTEKFVTQLKDELADMKLWKEKYDSLRTQAATAKERSEKRIRELEREKKHEEERLNEITEKAREHRQQLQQKIQQLQQENDSMQMQAATMREQYEKKVEEIEEERKERHRKQGEAEEKKSTEQQQKIQQLQLEMQQLNSELLLTRAAALQSPSASDAHVTSQVKKIMNSVFQTLRTKIDAHGTYKGSKVLVTVLDIIKRTTLKLVTPPLAEKQEVMEEKAHEVSLSFVTTSASDAPTTASTAGQETTPETVPGSLATVVAAAAQVGDETVGSASISLATPPVIPKIVLSVLSDVPEELQKVTSLDEPTAPSGLPEEYQKNTSTDVPPIPSDAPDELQINEMANKHQTGVLTQLPNVSSDTTHNLQTDVSEGVSVLVSNVTDDIQTLSSADVSTTLSTMTGDLQKDVASPGPSAPSDTIGDALTIVPNTISSDVAEDIQTIAPTQASDVAEDIQTTAPTQVSDVAEDIQTTAQTQASDVAEDIQTTAPTQVSDVAEDIQTTAPTQVSDVAEDIQTTAPTQVSDVAEDIQTITPTQASDVAEDIQTTAPTQVSDVAEDIQTTAPTQVSDVAEDIQTTAPTQVSDVAEDIQTPAPTQVSDVAEDIQTTAPTQVSDVAEDIQTAAPTQVSDVAEDIQTTAPTQASDVTEDLQVAGPTQATNVTEDHKTTTPKQSSSVLTYVADNQQTLASTEESDLTEGFQITALTHDVNVPTDDLQNADPAQGPGLPNNMLDDLQIFPPDASVLSSSETCNFQADSSTILLLTDSLQKTANSDAAEAVQINVSIISSDVGKDIPATAATPTVPSIQSEVTVNAPETDTVFVSGTASDISTNLQMPGTTNVSAASQNAPVNTPIATPETVHMDVPVFDAIASTTVLKISSHDAPVSALQTSESSETGDAAEESKQALPEFSRQDLLDHQDQKETTEQQDQKEAADQQDHKGITDQNESADQQDNKETAAQQDQRETADQKDHKETPDQQDHKETADQNESAEQQDNKEIADQQDYKETADQQGQRETADQNESAEQQDHKEIADQQDCKETADQKETAEQQDHKETADQQDQKETAEQQDHEKTADQQNQKETADQQDHEETAEQQDHEETADQQNQKETAEQQDHKETADQQDQEETAEQQEHEESASRTRTENIVTSSAGENDKKEPEITDISITPSPDSSLKEETSKETTQTPPEPSIISKTAKQSQQDLTSEFITTEKETPNSSSVNVNIESEVKASPAEDSSLPPELESPVKEEITVMTKETLLQTMAIHSQKSDSDIKELPPLFDDAEDDDDEYSSLFGPVGSDLKSKATVSIDTKPISKVGPLLAKKEADKKLDLDTDEEDKPQPPPPLFGDDSDDDLDWLS